MRHWLAELWRNRPSECRRRRAAWLAAYAENGLTEYEVEELARYNAETYRGVVFTPQHAARMAVLQDRYYRAAASV